MGNLKSEFKKYDFQEYYGFAPFKVCGVEIFVGYLLIQELCQGYPVQKVFFCSSPKIMDLS